MILPLFRRSNPTIAVLYGAIVAQSRDPRFYEAYGVPDTALGRFDLILLHLALVLRRLRAGDASAHTLAQGLFDTFCRDMDHNLREMGVGDQGVARQMRRVGEAFYGRAQAYDAALAEQSNDALAGTLIRNVYAEAAEVGVAAERLADYVRRTVHDLEAQAIEHLLGGQVTFPEPVKLAVAE